MTSPRCHHRWVLVSPGEGTIYAAHGARYRCRSCGREKVRTLRTAATLRDAEDLATAMETVHVSGLEDL